MIKYIDPNYPGMPELESKSDPCYGCKNGPQPSWYCSHCRNFVYACKLHNIAPATLDEGKPIVSGAAGTSMEGMPGIYSEEQKSTVNQHIAFFNKVVNGQMEHNIPLGSAEEAFLKSIFEHILQCMKSEPQSKTLAGYTDVK